MRHIGATDLYCVVFNFFLICSKYAADIYGLLYEIGIHLRSSKLTFFEERDIFF